MSFQPADWLLGISQFPYQAAVVWSAAGNDAPAIRGKRYGEDALHRADKPGQLAACIHVPKLHRFVAISGDYPLAIRRERHALRRRAKAFEFTDQAHTL